MKNLKFFKVLLLALSVGLFSCNKDEVETNDSATNTENSGVSQEIIDALTKLGIVTPSIEKVIMDNENDIPTEYYLIQGDYVLTADQILNPEAHQERGNKNNNKQVAGKQYRTHYNIYPWRTISIRGISGGEEGLSSQQAQQLAVAVKRYNDLGIGINFNLSYGSNRDGNEIVVKRVSWLKPNSGRAGFPTNGIAFHTAHLGNFNKLPNNTVATLIAHEIGHCIGMRHTDFFDRASCGGKQSNEGQGNFGAVHVPGTSTGRDANSTMNACIGNQSDFSEGDKTALRWMY